MKIFSNMQLAWKIPVLVAAAALISVIAVGTISYIQSANKFEARAIDKYSALT